MFIRRIISILLIQLHLEDNNNNNYKTRRKNLRTARKKNCLNSLFFVLVTSAGRIRPFVGQIILIRHFGGEFLRSKCERPCAGSGSPLSPLIPSSPLPNGKKRPITFLFVRQGVFERKNTRREAGGLSESKEKASIHDCVQCLLKVDHSSRFLENDRSSLNFIRALVVYSRYLLREPAHSSRQWPVV